jgi:hypothetical protein
MDGNGLYRCAVVDMRDLDHFSGGAPLHIASEVMAGAVAAKRRSLGAVPANAPCSRELHTTALRATHADSSRRRR